MTVLSSREKWSDYYLRLTSLMYPNEYVLRILVGDYPRLSLKIQKLDRAERRKKKILDASCGDGRNMRLLHDLGLDVYGTEISEEICNKVNKNLRDVGVADDQINVSVGDNENLAWQDGKFDYLLSWNAIYYLSSIDADICAHVKEYARVLNQGGTLICSVPSPRCYSLLDAREVKENVLLLNPQNHSSWGGGLLESMIFYSFKNNEHIENIFGEYFCDFRFGALSDDCFGLPLDYILFACTKK